MDLHRGSTSRTLGLFDVMLGIGAMNGVGVTLLLGIAAGLAGPALVLTFVLNGLLVLRVRSIPITILHCESGETVARTW
ncbi:MAG: hypothetical protein V3R13_03555 [Nitrososphaerales archaeon]